MGGTATLSTADSTTNIWNGTNNGATPAAGFIGGAANFAGNGQYIEIGNMGVRPAQGTISLWVQAPNRADFPNPFTTAPFGNDCGIQALRMELQSDGTLNGITGAQCIFNHSAEAFTTTYDPSKWHYLTLTYDTINSLAAAYYDGALSIDE